MRTRAAVALEAGKPLVVMDVEVEGPRAQTGEKLGFELIHASV